MFNNLMEPPAHPLNMNVSSTPPLNDASRDRVFAMLNYYHFVDDAIVYLLPTLMTAFYDMFQLTYTQISLILATNFGVIVLFQIFNGWLADKNREKWQYLIGVVLMAVSTFMLLFARDFYTLWLFAAINGMGLGFVHAILYVLGFKLYPKDKEVKMARQGFFGDFGKVIAIFSSALILFLKPGLWKLPIIIWGCIAIGLFIAALFVIPQFPFDQLAIQLTQNEATSQKFTIIPPKVFPSLKDRPDRLQKYAVVVLFLIFIFYSGTQEVSIKFISLYMHVQRQGPSATYSQWILGVVMGVGMIGTLVSGRLKRRFGFHKFLIAIYCVNILTLILFLLLDLDNLVADLIFAALIGYTNLSVYITVQTELSNYISFKRLGLGYGLLLGIGWSGAFTATLIVGPAADKYGLQVIYLVALILSMLVFILIFFVPKRVTKDSVKKY